jgi:hypothetical protein
MFLNYYTTLIYQKSIPVAARPKGPHTRTVLPSILTVQFITAQLDRQCVENSVRCAVKISGLCNFRNSRRFNCALHVGLQCMLCPQGRSKLGIVWPAQLNLYVWGAPKT